MLYALVALNVMLFLLLVRQSDNDTQALRALSAPGDMSPRAPFGVEPPEPAGLANSQGSTTVAARVKRHLLPLVEADRLDWDDTHLVCRTLVELEESDAAGSIFDALKRLDARLMRMASLALVAPGENPEFDFLPVPVGRTWEVEVEPAASFVEPAVDFGVNPDGFGAPLRPPSAVNQETTGFDDLARVLHTGTPKEAGAAVVRMARLHSGDPRLASLLVTAFEEAGDPYLSRCAIDAMRVAGVAETGFLAFTSSITAALTSRQPEVRYAAVRACSVSGNPELLARASHLSSDPAEFVSRAASVITFSGPGDQGRAGVGRFAPLSRGWRI